MEVEKIDMREVEEVGIRVLVCEEGIVEMEGVSTWEKGIREDVVGVSVVWGIDETHGETRGISLTNYVDTNVSL